MRILIKSAQIIEKNNPLHQQKVDVLIENGKIIDISSNIETSADQTITHKNLHISAGWFDSSVCFGEPGYEERETIENGLLTAAKSGFTAVALNPDTSPVIDNHASVNFLKNKSFAAATHLFPIGSLTQKGEGKELAELFDMKLAGAVAFGDYKKAIKNPNLLKIALQYSQSFNALIMSFPNEETLTKNAVVNEGKVSTKMGLKGMPNFAEELQISRDLEILTYTGGRLHIPTISTAGSVARIAKAKKEGLDVSCSVAIPNLFFTDEKLKEFDSVYKIKPPLRTEEDRKALIEGVKSGVIDMITSDHRPMNIEYKKLEFEQAKYGTLGLESAFGALNNLFGVEKTIELLTKNRNRFGLENPKIEKGKTAEITFFDPDENFKFKEENIYSQSKNHIFLEEELKGKALGVLSNNRLILNQQ